LDAAAFCETFDTPHPGGNGGEIDESRFAFSRWGFGRIRAASREPDMYGITEWSNPDGPPTMCGEEFTSVLPPDDVRVCNGQLNEVFHDAEGLPANSFMVRQPFDFSDGGTVVFDLDAKRNDGWDGHGWWLELWITAEPAPIPYHDAPSIISTPRSGVGIQIAPWDGAFEDLTRNEVAGVVVVRDYEFIRDGFGGILGTAEYLGEAPDYNTFRVRDTQPNRFRVVLNRDQIEIWASDWDTPDDLRVVLRATELGLDFDVGYVHFQHVHYNASKTPNCACEGEDPWDFPDPNGLFASPTQVYRWDNIGFDGPVYPFGRGYDVAGEFRDASFEDDGLTIEARDYGVRSGSVTVEGVDLTDALSATFNFNTDYVEPVRLRFNGNAWLDVAIPAIYQEEPEQYSLRTFSVPVPLADMVPGTNTIEIDAGDMTLGNLDLTIHPSR
jgi:hypothetical protein